MRWRLWWVACLVGVAVMTAAAVVPAWSWDATWWRRLEADWQQFAAARGWGVGLREGLMLA
jgi:hypothetical protein